MSDSVQGAIPIFFAAVLKACHRSSLVWGCAGVAS